MYWVGRRLALAALVAAALIGALVGALLGLPEEERPAARANAAERRPPVTAVVGPLRLVLPAGWRRLERRAAVPGLPEDALVLRSRRATAVLAQVTPTHPSLLPAALLEALVFPPGGAAPLSAGSLRALRYDNLAWRGARGSADVYVAPNSGGTATLVCRVDERYELVAEDIECEPLVRGLRLAQGRWLAPTPETAFLVALRPAIGRLSKERERARARLARAATPAVRGDAADAVSRAYAAARTKLIPVSPATPRAERVLELLEVLEQDYRRLAGRARRLDTARYSQSAAAIVRRERALQTALETWSASLAA